MLSKSVLLIGVFLLLVPVGGASGADLIVPSGTAVTKNSTESFGLFMVAGRLTVQAGANLTFTGDSHIDGVETAGIRPEIIINGASLYLGSRMNMGADKVGNGFVGGINYEYLGKVDDFRVYSCALSPDEVLSMYSGGQLPANSPANLYLGNIIDSKDLAKFAVQWLNPCE